ncbi:ATP-binding protein [Streptomyces sp. WAC 01325]|uniref:GTP-binding protein n=1 Tax=Streptomyces sp. WAC 01325 TaxID=2203202 RepID=UPI000F896272|nr:ATP/GTP-binding protein [Streptomyces sp. WAC 01325]RSM93721.1 ATP-binding protein [Streptomyces sp. WAC 01325]
MVSAPGSDAQSFGAAALADSVQSTVKLLIVGHFGVGKTTLVNTVSEIPPLRTEELMTEAGAPVDDLSNVGGKSTTTVALDFGRLTISDTLALYLFGTPGQDRFAQIWRDIAYGALGALVLVDTARLEQAFEVMGRLEERSIPYAVAVNDFAHSPVHDSLELRGALDLLPETPLVHCDARDRRSCFEALISLVEYVQTQDSP